MKEEKDLWQKNKWILYAFIVTVILAFILNRCNNSTPNTTTQKVTTKEVIGTFEAVKPKNLPIDNHLANNDKSTSVKNAQVEPSRNPGQLNDLILKLIAENKKLTDQYKTANDSLKQAMYNQSIQLNDFSQTFDDSKVKIDVSGVSRGTVESIKANYKVYSQNIEAEVKQKQRVFALRAGGEYGNTVELNKSVFKGNLEFENKKGNSYNIGYDTDERIWVGIKITVFEVKK